MGGICKVSSLGWNYRLMSVAFPKSLRYQPFAAVFFGR